MPNFRTKLYPDYKANRREQKAESAEIRVHPIKGGWRGMIWLERTQEPIHSMIVYSPHHEEIDAMAIAEGLKAICKAQGLKAKKVDLLTHANHIERYNSVQREMLAVVAPDNDYDGTQPQKYTQIVGGIIYRIQRDTCESCSGAGFVEEMGDAADCSDCQGLGYVFSSTPELTPHQISCLCHCGAAVILNANAPTEHCPVCDCRIWLNPDRSFQVKRTCQFPH